MTQIERTSDVKTTSWMSSERHMYVQFRPCVQGVKVICLNIINLFQTLFQVKTLFPQSLI